MPYESDGNDNWIGLQGGYNRSTNLRLDLTDEKRKLSCGGAVEVKSKT